MKDVTIQNGNYTIAGFYGVVSIEGNVSLTGTYLIGANQSALYADMGSLTLNGSFTINSLANNKFAIYANNNISFIGTLLDITCHSGILSSNGDITFDMNRVDIGCQSACGVIAHNGSIIIKKGTVGITCGDSINAKWRFGMRANKDITIQSGIVTVAGRCAIYTEIGTITISGNVTANGIGWGVYTKSGNIVVNNTLTANGNNSAISTESGTITITNPAKIVTPNNYINNGKTILDENNNTATQVKVEVVPQANHLIDTINVSFANPNVGGTISLNDITISANANGENATVGILKSNSTLEIIDIATGKAFTKFETNKSYILKLTLNIDKVNAYLASSNVIAKVNSSIAGANITGIGENIYIEHYFYIFPNSVGTTENNPAICSSFTALKTAMENSSITYVQINDMNSIQNILKNNQQTAISSINVVGTKTLILNGNSIIKTNEVIRLNGNYRYKSLIGIDEGSNLTIKGEGTLTYKCALNNSNYKMLAIDDSSVIYNEGTLTINSGAIIGDYFDNYGKSIKQHSGQLTINDGTIMSKVSAYSVTTIGLYTDGGITQINGGTYLAEDTNATGTQCYGVFIANTNNPEITFYNGTITNLYIPAKSKIKNYIAYMKYATLNGIKVSGSDNEILRDGIIGFEISNIIDYAKFTVTAPKENETPSTYISPYDDTKYIMANGTVSWYDNTENRTLEQGDKFIAGHEYILYATISARYTNNYLFNVNEDTMKPDIAVELNSNLWATVSKTYEQEPSRYVTISYNFGVCNDSVIEEINIYNVIKPVAGNTPSYIAYADGTGWHIKASNYDNDLINGIRWVDETTGHIMNKDEIFVAGHNYRVNINIEVDDTNLYEFYNNHGILLATVKINGESNNVSYLESGSNLHWYQTVSYTFIWEQEQLNEVAVIEIETPVAGNTPNSVAITTNPYLYKIEYIYWYLASNDSEILLDDYRFIAGLEYKVEIKLVSHIENTAIACKFITLSSATINGIEADSKGIANRGANVYMWKTYTAQSKASYTVSFNNNGGIGTMANVSGIFGNYTLPTCSFTAPQNKVFIGWNVDGVLYDENAEVKIYNNTEILAVWKDIETYTITFNSNGGTGTMPEVNKVFGTYILPANEFTAPINYQFKCWIVNGILKNIGETITVTTNTFIKAYWVKKVADITLNENTVKTGIDVSALFDNAKDDKQEVEINFGDNKIKFNSDAVNSIAGKEDVTIKVEITENVENINVENAQLVMNITLENATFNAGKATIIVPFDKEAPQGTITKIFFVDDNNVKHEITNAKFENGNAIFETNHFSTYVVAFDVIKYKVSFNANGGTGSMVEIEYAGTYILPTNEFIAPTGKQFKGWSTSVNGTVISGTTINITANVELFAIWETITYTITATSGANGTISPNGTQTVNYGEDVTFIISASAGYKIKDVKVNELSVGAVASYTFENVTTNATITAEFEIITYTITFNANNGTGIMANATDIVGNYILPANEFTAPTGKQFKGWATSTNGEVISGTTYNVTTDIELFAIWETITYTITATAGVNGTISPNGTQTVNYSEELTFTISASSGYKIKNVKVNGLSVGAVTTYTFENVTANATITAEFELITYTITFNANDGTGSMANATGILGTYTLPTNGFTAPTGKQFKGWATSANGEVITETTINVTANTELFAIWEDIPVTTYTVTFNANGGTGTMANIEFVGTYTLPTNGFTAPTGKQFKGWSLTANGEVIDGTTINISADTELFAIWEDIPVTKYTISFNANSGTGTMANIEFAGTYTLPTNRFTAPTGKQFKGWSLTANGEVIDGTTINISADTELFAIWEDILVATYTVTFNANGGTGSMANTTEIVGTYTLPANGFTAPTGKQFKGWATSANGEVITETTINVSANTELFAIWEDIPSSNDPGNTGNQDNKNDTEDKGMGVGAIVAIVIASTLVLGTGGFALVWFVLKKKTWADFLAIFNKK
ncbi:MAG: InlB B-repeat-containing protein [Clostridia bacterium]|nr:InlB B-repeat-containing protein [Clostridia bacterium]